MVENGWSDKSEEMVKNIGDLSLGYKNMYTRASKYYGKIHFVLIILLYLTTGVGNILNIYNITNSIKYYNSLVLVLSFIELIAIVCINQGNLRDMSINYRNFASKYANIVSNIRRQLLLERADREIMSDYTSWIAKSYDDLFEMAPPLDMWIVDEYKIKADKRNLPVPELVSQPSAVNIIKEEKDVVIHVKEKKRLSPKQAMLTANIHKYDDMNMKYELDRLRRQ